MVKFLSYMRSYIQWVGFGFLLAFYVGLIFILTLFIKSDKLEPILHLFCRQMLWVSGIELHLHGIENLDRKKSYVVMFNHFNFLDHFLIYYALHIRLRGLEKEAHFHWPVYGTFMRQIGIIPIPPRGNTEKALEALEIAKKEMQKGTSMLIAPEGTRTVDGNLGKFKKGGFYLAIQTQSDILPVIFQGMYAFNQKKSKLLTPGRVDLFIEKPISTQGMTENDVVSLRNQVREVYDRYYETLQ
jgi:1-acyl-sn-glycerol-3-phosphate acyltransferase